MRIILVVAILVLLAGFGFAQSAEEYCATERAEGESCYRSCCEMLGYTWSGSGAAAGCNVGDSEQDYLSQQCGYCTESYVQCVDYYEQQASGGGYTQDYYPDTGSSSGGGCCGSAMILLAVPLLAAFRR